MFIDVYQAPGKSLEHSKRSVDFVELSAISRWQNLTLLLTTYLPVYHNNMSRLTWPKSKLLTPPVTNLLISQWSLSLIKALQVLVAQLCPTLCNPMDCSPSGSSVHEIFQARIHTGVGCHFLLQGIFPTQGPNLGLLHSRQILYHLSH